MTRKGALGVALAMALVQGAAAKPVETLEEYQPATPEDAAADKVTAAENLKYVEMSRAVDARNAAKKAAYEAALAEHEAALAAHEASVARWQAEVEALKAAHAKAMADWEARVKACEAGDYSQCQP